MNDEDRIAYEEYKTADAEGQAVYARAKANGLCDIDRWEEGVDHHLKSLELMRFLAKYDFEDMDDVFCWRTGGDGDNGESLMFQMDAYFEQKDKDNEQGTTTETV